MVDPLEVFFIASCNLETGVTELEIQRLGTFWIALRRGQTDFYFFAIKARIAGIDEVPAAVNYVFSRI